MATIPDSIKARLDADWTGAGGTEPTYYVSEDFRAPPPLGKDAVWIVSSTVDTDPRPVNDKYVTEYHTVSLIVNTQTSEDRLKELSDEVVRIMNATAITGATYQRYKGRKNISDKDNTGIWHYQELITFDIREHMKDTATAYGAGASGYFLDEDDMASDSDTSVASQQSIKAYVDAVILTEDTLAEMNDVDLGGPTDNDVLVYNNATGKWEDEAQSALTGVDHDTITNTHDLTTDIDHDTITNTHDLTTDIDHDALTNFEAGEHFTMLDEDNMASDSDTQAATQQSIKKYVDDNAGGGGDAFKTITGITNDVVADAADDTLTLASTDAKLTIVGTAATDTVTFSVIEGQIDHDALTNFDANEHKLEAAIDHDALTNFAANEHFLKTEVGLDDLDDCGTLTGAYLQDALYYGSGNSVWVPFVFVQGWTAYNYRDKGDGVTNIGTQSSWTSWQINLPTNRGGLKLYWNTTRICLNDADVNNYVSRVLSRGRVYDSKTDFDDDATDRTAQGEYDYDLSDQDCSAFDAILVQVYAEVDTDAALCLYVLGELYYAA